MPAGYRPTNASPDAAHAWADRKEFTAEAQRTPKLAESWRSRPSGPHFLAMTYKWFARTWAVGRRFIHASRYFKGKMAQPTAPTMMRFNARRTGEPPWTGRKIFR